MSKSAPKDPDRPQPFTGFGADALAFFRELDANQDRDWFLANKARYETEVRMPLVRLVGALTLALAGYDVPLTGNPKTSLFRINRDVRFAKDKRPYRTNAGAAFTRDGTKGSPGLLYVHHGLDGTFAALGFYAPEPPHLLALRTRIATRQDRWRAVKAHLAGKGLALSREWSAARLPRGFDAAEVGDLAEDLRLHSLVVTLPLTAQDAASPALVATLAGFAETGLPLLEFGWQALADQPRDGVSRPA